MPPRHPLVYTALSAVSFALMAVAAKLASKTLSGGEIAFIRFALMLLPFVAVPRLARKALAYERLDLLLYRGIFGGTAVLLYFLAIAHVPVGTATLLNYSSPIFSVLFAALLLGEGVRRWVLLPAAVAFLGVAGVAGQAGVGLGFKILPLVFSKMPAGAFFGGAFFFMLFLAAVTSSISMLQPGIAFVEESLGVGRKASVAILGLLTTFGTGFVLYFTADLKALDTLDFWVGTFLIFVLATIQIIIFGWKWGIDRGFEELHRGAAFRVPWIFRPIIKWVCPGFLLSIFAMWLMKEIFGYDFTKGSMGAVSGYVTDLFGAKANLPAQLSVALVIAIFVFFGLLTARSRAYSRAEQGLPKHD